MISVVIPSYNRCEGMLALLADLRRQQGVDFEVVVVDDCSPDDSVERIREEFPEVRLFVNEKNGGPAVTRNRGIREARGELIVGFDSDVTLPDSDLLLKVRAAFDEDEGTAGLAFRLLDADGVNEDKPRWWHPVPIEEYATRSFPTPYFSGTAYAFRRNEVMAAGLYPEILYMHYEEVELAYRILDNGGTIVHRPELRVCHHANEVSRRSEIQVFYKPRNQILLAVACFPVTKAIAYLAPRTGFQFLKACWRRSLPDFFRAMSSASSLMAERIAERKPLARETFRRIKAMGSPRARREPAETA